MIANVDAVPLPVDAHRKLRAARAYAGLSQDELADALGYHRNHLGAIERGAKSLPAKEKLEEAMRLCGVPYAFLEQEGFAVFDQPATLEALDDRIGQFAAELAMLRRDVRAALADQDPAGASPPVRDPREIAAPGLQAAQRAADEQTQATPRARRRSA